MKLSLLGGLTPRQFLRDHWQKKPLLIRQAIPGFKGVLSTAEIMALAGNEDAQSRLIMRTGTKWRMEQGPFAKRHFKQLPKSNWTVLVQDVNHFVDGGMALLRRFNFIPYARLDDLMVSYATPGGGAGPHFDSYDVFLLQGEGERRWRISAQEDLSLVPNLPLKILRDFRAEQEWLLQPGDMLYLPPGYAHDGVAVTACTTYSIGFRAPSNQEILQQFLNHVQDELTLDGIYSDPDLTPQSSPATISKDMVGKVAALINKLSWKEADYARFLGKYLTEPKAHVYFDPPKAALTLAQFRQQCKKHGVMLDRKSRMLLRAPWLFINGECVPLESTSSDVLRELAHCWMIKLEAQISDLAVKQLYTWYRDGYIRLGNLDA
ncbi:MAG: cupin domain-containing protein [Burkholderiales bacterium]